MSFWAAGIVGGVASFLGGLLGFQICRWSKPRNGGFPIDGGAIVGVLIGYPVGSVLGLVAGLVGARLAGGPYPFFSALLLALIPPLAPVALVFAGGKRRS